MMHERDSGPMLQAVATASGCLINTNDQPGGTSQAHKHSDSPVLTHECVAQTHIYAFRGPHQPSARGMQYRLVFPRQCVAESSLTKSSPHMHLGVRTSQEPHNHCDGHQHRLEAVHLLPIRALDLLSPDIHGDQLTSLQGEDARP